MTIPKINTKKLTERVKTVLLIAIVAFACGAYTGMHFEKQQQKAITTQVNTELTSAKK